MKATGEHSSLVFSDGKERTYYIQEIICPVASDVRYLKITTDFLMERKNNTWYLMTNLQGDLHVLYWESLWLREIGLSTDLNKLRMN